MALVVAAVVAYRRGDVARLVEVAARADRVPGSRDQAMLEVARRSIAAVVAEMSGDLPGALAELDAAPLTLVPPAISTAVQHLVIHNLLLSGRADDAVAVARGLLVDRPDRLARYLSAIAGWMAGEPTELLALNRSTVDIPAVTSRDFFVRRTVVAAMLASTGQRDSVHRLVTGSSPVADATSNARDAVLDAVAPSAVRGRRPRRRGCGPVHRSGCGRSRRQPNPRSAPAPLPSPGVRARSVGRPPAGTRRQWGRPMSTPGAPAGAWSTCAPGTLDVELLWIPARCSPPSRCPGRSSWQRFSTAPVRQMVSTLAEWLVDQVPEPARAELRHLAGGSARCGPAAADLLARLPATPAQPLEIFVLGPLQVAFGGVPTAPATLRRTRVRTLLALLVVHRTLSRERAIDLLWPDLSPRDGSRNLRVTLTYLRQLLEPGRPTGEASYHLRADGATITLHPSDHILVDLWELHRLQRDTDQNRGQGDPGRTIALLDAATAWWRGEPLADLASVAGHQHEIEHIRVVQVDSLLELGELRLVRGDADRARTDAERALDLDPYSERAHRLAIAAALRTHDQRRTDAVRHRTPRCSTSSA